MRRRKKIKSHNVTDTSTFEGIRIKHARLFFKLTPKWLISLFILSLTIIIVTAVLLTHYFL